MREVTHGDASTLRWGIMACGLLVGVADARDIDEVLLATWLLALGSMLTFAFRSDPGPVCRQWHRQRQSGPQTLYRTYALAGPWAWRLGLGMFVGAAVGTAL